MLADYLSRLLGAKKPSPAFLLSTHFKQTSTISRCKMMISKCSRPSWPSMSGLQICQNKIGSTSRTWQKKCSKTKTKLSGSGWKILTTPGPLSTCQHDIVRKQCAKLMKEYLEVTMPLTKHTWRCPPPTTGLRWSRILKNTKTSAFPANSKKNPQTGRHHWPLFQFWTVQTYGFMQIFLAQWSQQTVTKNSYFASLMPSLSTLWSLWLPARMLGSQCHLQRLVCKIWNSSPSSHWQWQRICQQALSGAFPTPQCQPYQDLSGTSTMQRSSGGVQQNCKKFLQSFVDNMTLNWETFLPALAISYNTSYHSTIATTPFELLFGEKARLLSFPNKDI